MRTSSFFVIQRLITEPIREGSIKNNATEKAMPRTTEIVTMTFCAFSPESFFSSHRSNFDWLSEVSPSSSANRSAEYMSAFTPVFIDLQKLKTPRIKGSFFREKPSVFLTGDTFVCIPSFVRTTTADFSGPSIMMPSMRACPPIIVLNFSAVLFFPMVFLSIAPLWAVGWSQPRRRPLRWRFQAFRRAW